MKISPEMFPIILLHMLQKFIPAGSQRIASTQTDKLSTAAFKTQFGKIVLIVQNDNQADENFNIKFAGKPLQ